MTAVLAIDGEHKLCWSEQTIFQNIPPGPFFTTVKLAVSVNLIFMYPVTMLPASKAVEEFIGIDAARQRVASACCRTAIVAAMSITGMLLPSFEFLQALTGSLTMFTALSMPPYAYWLLATPGEMSRAHVVWCWFVLAFGLAALMAPWWGPRGVLGASARPPQQGDELGGKRMKNTFIFITLPADPT